MNESDLRRVIREEIREGFSFFSKKTSKHLNKPKSIEPYVWNHIVIPVKKAVGNYLRIHPEQNTPGQKNKITKKYAAEFARAYNSMRTNPHDWDRFLRRRYGIGEQNAGI